MTHDKDTKRNPEGSFLETHFEAARQTAPAPGKDLVQRILADANEVQSGLSVSPEVSVRSAPRGIVALLQTLGGWPAAASLSSAAAVGLWIGIAPPDALTLVAQDLLPTQVADGDDATASDGFDFFEEML
ncbi:hypothetical protein [Roseovarius rhodophyticola]|uniref:DUF3619 family protein n=1 Tax=Roseovarius rhodophyticola TaxID=3080827 RepID=A0ABZ2TGY9_9RHOB|nr:hypothetical protein [Roseovarius sp. W115]MDV2929249.1 hypothetical protein [Roseovarius sp. W115]